MKTYYTSESSLGIVGSFLGMVLSVGLIALWYYFREEAGIPYLIGSGILLIFCSILFTYMCILKRRYTLCQTRGTKGKGTFVGSRVKKGRKNLTAGYYMVVEFVGEDKKMYRSVIKTSEYVLDHYSIGMKVDLLIYKKYAICID